jgi:hypothetical protein
VGTVAPAEEEAQVEPVVRLCRLCNERPVCASRLKAWDYRCSRCRNATPAHRTASKRYRGSARGRAVNERSNHRRIWIGRGYHSRATSLELAAVVNAHTKERLRAFTSAQRDEVV